MASLQRASSGALQRACSAELPCRAPVVHPLSAHPGRRPPLRSSGGRCAALPTDSGAPSTSGQAPPTSGSDPFVAAASRLQRLLSRVGDGEDEFTNSLVAEESPEKKLQLNVVVGGAVTIGAVIVASLCGKDPWGGASFSLDTLGAAAVGAMVSLPMVLLRKWSWTPAAYNALPALQDVHNGQLELHRPWLTRMTTGEVALMMALEVLPLTLLLFPAAQGGITATLAMYSHLLHNPGLASHEEQLAVVALLITAAVSGVGRSLELSVSEEEYELVQTASANADRYYRTMATDVYHTPADAARAADAFRYVSQAWLQTKSEASLLAGVMTATDVLLLGLLWHWTGDLAAPAVAALAVNWVDVQALHGAVLRKEAKAAGRGSPNNSA